MHEIKEGMRCEDNETRRKKKIFFAQKKRNKNEKKLIMNFLIFIILRFQSIFLSFETIHVFILLDLKLQPNDK